MDPTEGNDNTENEEAKKKSGGQPGNQNARKPTDLYVRHMSPRGRELYEEAKKVTGLREEIQLVRSKLDWAMEKYPDDDRMHLKLIKLISHLDAVQQRLDGPAVTRYNSIMRRIEAARWDSPSTDPGC